MSRGHATRSWLVVILLLRIFYVACVYILFTVPVHHSEWDVSADSVSLFQLGQITRELQCGVWGGRWQGAGVSSHLGSRHLQESLCGNVGSLQQRSSSGNFSIGSDGWCIGAWRFGGINQRWLGRPCGRLQWISGQWVSSEAPWLPSFRSLAA